MMSGGLFYDEFVNPAFKSICLTMPTSTAHVQERLTAAGKCLKGTQHAPSHTLWRHLCHTDMK